MADNPIKETKNGKYLKKTDINSYVHYQFDTNDGVVYLSEKIDGANGSGADYAKDATLHQALCALYTLASQGGQAATDLATLATLVNGHLNNANNPHKVNKSQVGLGSVVNAPMDNEPTKNSNNYVKSGGVYTAVKKVSDKADQAISIANGQSHAYVFADVNGLMAGTLSDNQFISGYKVSDSIYIIAPDVSDFWISAIASTGTASTDNAIKTAKKGDTVVVKWASSYVSLTALESKRDLSGYVTTGAFNSALKNIYDKTTTDEKYVPYSGAKDHVNLGDHTLTVSNGAQTTEISKGHIVLRSSTIGSTVDIAANGITVNNSAFYAYPEGSTSPLATVGFVTGQGYQTETQVDALIKRTSLSFGGDVFGKGNIVGQPIELSLNNQNDLPDKDEDRTFSAVHVNKKGIVTSGAQQIVFASTINDSALNKLVIGGVAIIDA